MNLYTPEQELAKKISDYFFMSLTDQDKRKLASLIEEYRSKIQPINKIIKIEHPIIKVIQGAKEWTRADLQLIAQEIADKYEVGVNVLLSTRRTSRLVKARNEFIHRVFQTFDISLSDIARFIGYRDHSSVHHHLYLKKQYRKKAAA